jgi:hypothetical protein
MDTSTFTLIENTTTSEEYSKAAQALEALSTIVKYDITKFNIAMRSRMLEAIIERKVEINQLLDSTEQVLTTSLRVY